MRKHASRIAAVALAAAFLSISGRLPCGRASAAPPTMTCIVVDSATGAPMPSRCRVIDRYNSNRFPYSFCMFHTLNGGYFYSNGTCSLYVPTGKVIVHAGRGFEFRERIDTITVVLMEVPCCGGLLRRTAIQPV